MFVDLAKSTIDRPPCAPGDWEYLNDCSDRSGTLHPPHPVRYLAAKARPCGVEGGPACYRGHRRDRCVEFRIAHCGLPEFRIAAQTLSRCMLPCSSPGCGA